MCQGTSAQARVPGQVDQVQRLLERRCRVLRQLSARCTRHRAQDSTHKRLLVLFVEARLHQRLVLAHGSVCRRRLAIDDLPRRLISSHVEHALTRIERTFEKSEVLPAASGPTSKTVDSCLWLPAARTWTPRRRARELEAVSCLTANATKARTTPARMSVAGCCDSTRSRNACAISRGVVLMAGVGGRRAREQSGTSSSDSRSHLAARSSS